MQNLHWQLRLELKKISSPPPPKKNDKDNFLFLFFILDYLEEKLYISWFFSSFNSIPFSNFENVGNVDIDSFNQLCCV
jgi:hypothetical protein